MRKSILKVSILFMAMLLTVNASQMVQAADPEPFFSLHYMAPTSNPARMQYAQLLEQQFEKIGIEAELDLVAWAAIGPRSYYTVVGPYDEGGYDIASIGMSLGSAAGHPGDSMLGVYGTKSIPPQGFNLMYWSDQKPTWNNYRAAEQQLLIEKIVTEPNLTKAAELMVDWQNIYYDAMPQLIVYVQYEVAALSSGFYGYDPALPYPTSSVEDHWLTSDYTGTADSVNIGVSAKGDMFMGIIADDVYDQYSASIIHDGLVGNAPSNELVLPEGTDREEWMEENYPGLGYMALYPRVASAMGEFSEDLMSYTISMRDDVYFHDGHRVDMNDVAFTFRAHLTPDIGSSVYSTLSFAFGSDADGAGHGNDSFVITDEDSDGHDETIKFLFNATYVPFLTDYLGSNIYPEHILGSATPGELQADWQVAPADWLTHPMNTGDSSPIGCGPLVWYSRDASSGTIVLKKFDGIEWTGSAWDETASTAHYNAANLADMPSTYTLVQSSLDSAVAELKAGTFNSLDPQWTMGNIYEELNSHDAITAVLTTETGWQALYFHPEYKGADGVYHLNKKGVRHAISHIVPREDIVEFVLNGLGIPGYTPVPMTSWGAAQPEAMLEYKKTITFADGTGTPEADETTAHDSYDVQLALDWMESEGYDVEPFRALDKTQPAPGFTMIVGSLALIGAAAFIRKRR